MSPFVRNLILSAGLIALFLSAVRGIAAIPHAMHSAGAKVPATLEELVVVVLEGK